MAEPRVRINFHETYTAGVARSWEAEYKGYRSLIIRVAQGVIPINRIFVYDENGRELECLPDLDGSLHDAAIEARKALRRLRDPLGD